ncbi:MAG: hypothetical protein SOZ23_01445 [Methanosphaera sp.]|nr:hypothetical protein [Methanosphaera sp.]MDD6535009.1 hypothetical protein [Methanosphaera sp.]MDY3955442.1 hypothetical protein [Methanosphaera sp.]
MTNLERYGYTILVILGLLILIYPNLAAYIIGLILIAYGVLELIK